MICDLIIKARFVLPMNESLEIIQGGFVAIMDGKIVAVSSVSNISDYQAGETIDAGNSILMPGLINTHTHASMVYFRGLADDLPLDEWLGEHIWPAEARLVKPDFIRTGAELAILEMIKSGTTCFSDMYFFEEVAGEVAESAGIRAMLAEGILDFPTPSCQNSDESIKKTVELYEKYKNNELINIAIAPHSIYTVAKEKLIKIKETAEKYSLPIHMHISETEKEVNDCLKKNKKTPVAYLDELGILNAKTMAAHSVWLNENDLKIYKNKRVGVAHCPASNMKLASGIAPVVKMLSSEIKVGLGTDGAASNNTLDMFGEMRLAALLHKVANLDPTLISAREAIKMATISGAKVLGMVDKIGSLEAGKSADMITINLDQPHLAPIYDPYSHLVYAARGSDVNDVVINGKIVMKNKIVKTLDSEGILSKARNFTEKIN